MTHQIGHLHWTDLASVTAITDEAEFAEGLKLAAANPTGYVDEAAEEMALIPPAELLASWREGRVALQAALRSVPDGEKIGWFGPPMSPVSMATARLMETWAHSRDVAEALGIDVPRTSRAKHVAHIGVRARGFSYMVHGEEIPEGDVRVELTGPDGDLWTWGPEDADRSGDRRWLRLRTTCLTSPAPRRRGRSRRGPERRALADDRAGIRGSAGQ